MSRLASVAVKVVAPIIAIGVILSIVAIYSVAAAGLLKLCLMGLECLFPTFHTPSFDSLLLVGVGCVVIYFFYLCCKEKTLEKGRN